MHVKNARTQNNSRISRGGAESRTRARTEICVLAIGLLPHMLAEYRMLSHTSYGPFRVLIFASPSRSLSRSEYHMARGGILIISHPSLLISHPSA